MTNKTEIRDDDDNLDSIARWDNEGGAPRPPTTFYDVVQPGSIDLKRSIRMNNGALVGVLGSEVAYP